jgi:hypothetical protein
MILMCLTLSVNPINTCFAAREFMELINTIEDVTC